MSVQTAVGRQQPASKGLGHQIVPGDRLGVGPHQQLEDAQLRGSELEILLVDLSPAGTQIDAQRSGLDHSVDGLPVPRDPAQHGPDSRHELSRAERFGQIIVGAHLEADHPIDLLAPGRQHDDGNPVQRPDAPQHLETGKLRQHDVQDHEVDGSVPEARERRGSAADRLRIESFRTEILDEHRAKLVVVVDYQQLGLRSRTTCFRHFHAPHDTRTQGRPAPERIPWGASSHFFGAPVEHPFSVGNAYPGDLHTARISVSQVRFRKPPCDALRAHCVLSYRSRHSIRGVRTA